jgi:hypothetical protein
MRRIVFTGLFLLLVLLASCTTSSPEPSRVASATALQPIIEHALTLELEQKLAYLRGQLGTPHSVLETPFTNLHDDRQIDTLRSFVYDGLQLDTYQVSATGKEFLLQLAVDKNGFMSSFGVHIGSSRHDVRSLLGEPDWTEDQTLVYVVGDDTPDQLVLWFEGDTVSRIAWQFYWS